MKYIFITGGVISSLGKGIVASALGSLLEARGYKVRIKKMDPYLNVDPGTMNPYQHGEVFVTDDGSETDMDLGHYERFTSVNCKSSDSVSAGKIYSNILKKERQGKYLGETIQVVPHVTDDIQEFITTDITNEDFLIGEIGGTIGDIESTPFLEALRQFINVKGKENVVVIHATMIPYLENIDELKTKPTQHSVRNLQFLGIKADIILCRTSKHLSNSIVEKIGLFCNVPTQNVIEAYDQDNIYNIPLAYHNEGLDEAVLKHFNISYSKINLSKWEDISNKIKDYNDNNKSITIAIVGKYTKVIESYKSLVEALNHAGIKLGYKVKIKWINSEEITDKCNNKDFQQLFSNVAGVIIAPGFGKRGVEGKINAVKYLRENKLLPTFAILKLIQ